jgi:hypothetical protein
MAIPQVSKSCPPEHAEAMAAVMDASETSKFADRGRSDTQDAAIADDDKEVYREGGIGAKFVRVFKEP